MQETCNLSGASHVHVTQLASHFKHFGSFGGHFSPKPDINISDHCRPFGAIFGDILDQFFFFWLFLGGIPFSAIFSSWKWFFEAKKKHNKMIKITIDLPKKGGPTMRITGWKGDNDQKWPAVVTKLKMAPLRWPKTGKNDRKWPPKTKSGGLKWLEEIQNKNVEYEWNVHSTYHTPKVLIHRKRDRFGWWVIF